MAKPLKLEVLLGAIDKATGPLKKITQGSDKTAQALKASRDELRQLERAQKDLRGFRELKRQSESSRRALKDQQDQVRDLSRAMRNAEGDTEDLTRRRDAAIRQARQLSDQYESEQRQLRQLRDGMNRVDGVTGTFSEQQRTLQTRIGQVNEELREQQRELGDVARKQRQAADAANRYQRGMGHASRMMGAGAGGLATGGTVLYGGARMLTPGIDYGAQMSAVQAVGRFEKDDPRFQALKDQSRELGASTAFSATEVGAGQEFLLRAGMSAEAIKASMGDVLNLALANNTELGRAADIASNIAGTFKVDMEAEGSMGRVADILSGTASRANVDLEMLGETMKYLGGAEDLKLSMEQAAAMAGMMGNIGIQGSQAGTTMRAMMNRLTEPAKEGADAMASIGLQVADANGNMRAMPDILRDINKATADLGNVERKAILQKIFGAEAGSGMAELVNGMSSGQLDEFIASLGENYGENARMAGTMSDNIQGDLKGLSSAWEEVGITLTDTNEGPLRDLVQKATEVVRAIGVWMNENPELTAQIATAAAGVAGLVAAGGALTLALGSILGPIVTVRYGLAMLRIQTGGAGGTISRFTSKILPALRGSIVRSAGSISLMARGWQGLGQAWRKSDPAALLTPLKKLSKGITAMPGAIAENIKSVTDWSKSLTQRMAQALRSNLGLMRDTARIGLSNLRRGLLDAAAASRQYVAANGIMGTALNGAKGGIKGLWNILKGGFISALSATGSALRVVGQSLLFVGRAALMNPIGLVITAIAGGALLVYKYWQPIKAFFTGFWQGLRDGLQPVAESLAPAFQALGNVLAPLKPIWDGIASALGTLWGWISTLLEPVQSTGEQLDAATSAGERFGKWLATIVNVIPNVIGTFAEFGANIVGGIINGITEGMSRLGDTITGMGESIKNWFKEALGINSPSRVFAGFGSNLLEGLINGIDASWQTLRDAIGNTADAVVGWFKDKLGINSPSRVFAELGIHTIDGLNVGLDRQRDEPAKRVRDIAQRVRQAGAGIALGAVTVPAVAELPINSPVLPTVADVQLDRRPALTSPTPNAQATGDNITINVYGAPGQDTTALTQEINRVLEERDRNKAARRRSSLRDID